MVVQLLKTFFLITLFYVAIQGARAQESSIQLGKKNIALDEPFAITLHIISSSTHANNTHSPFPEIPGMAKRDISSTTKASRIDGKAVMQYSITQYYLAMQEGKFTLPAFSMLVNDQTVQAKGTSITVGPPKNPNYTYQKNLYEELVELEQERELAENQEDVFFALTTSKERIYVGEGFMLILALYVAESNRVELKSYKAGAQLVEILKSIRPANCWEENMNIDEFQSSTVIVNRKKYTRYKVYQAAFYPFNAETIHFPKVGLKMLKYRRTRNEETGELVKNEELVSYYTQPKSVFVKQLPPHPLREKVSVGNYRLTEAISNHQLQTGKSFNYQFRISGEGNIPAIQFPQFPKTPAFDFYPPTTVQHVSHTDINLQGSKSFTFYGIPKEPGTYVLRNYFEWVFFNPQKERYDTLSSSIRLKVTGESQKNVDIHLNESGPLYEKIRNESQQLHALYKDNWVKTFANLFILLMFLATIGLFFIKQ